MKEPVLKAFASGCKVIRQHIHNSAFDRVKPIFKLLREIRIYSILPRGVFLRVEDV